MIQDIFEEKLLQLQDRFSWYWPFLPGHRVGGGQRTVRTHIRTYARHAGHARGVCLQVPLATGVPWLRIAEWDGKTGFHLARASHLRRLTLRRSYTGLPTRSTISSSILHRVDYPDSTSLSPIVLFTRRSGTLALNVIASLVNHAAVDDAETNRRQLSSE